MNRRFVALGFVMALVLGPAAASSQAQWAIDFAFGGGPHCHGRWHGYYGYYGGWYRPYPYYVAPPPVVYVPSAPQVVTPAPVIIQQSAAATTPAPTPIAATSPSIRANALPTNSIQRLVQLRNPTGSGGTVSFVIDGKTEASLAPGEVKPLGSNNAYVVEFDRGGDFGTTRRELVEGSYEFVVGNNGWDLQRMPTEAALQTPDPLVRRNALPTTR
jgi:hypothetical protein